MLPGVTLNSSRSGPSISLGVRGAKVTVGPEGNRAAVGPPCTGLFYTEHPKSSSPPQPEQKNRHLVLFLIIVLFRIFIAFMKK
ncbi:MAG: DUF4236 domain-containing protein [Dissulfurispiraceae bacterium]